MISAVFRVAGGARLGLGHLRRCWTLADRLRASGVAVRMVTTTDEGRAATAAAGLAALAEATESSIAATAAALRTCPGPRVAVVDDPDVDDGALAVLRSLAPVACFDDLGQRTLAVDLVVNGSAGAGEIAYRGAPDTRFLLGPCYVVLREAFACAPERPAAAGVRRLLLLAGGADHGRATARVLPTMLATVPEAAVDVVMGPFARPTPLEDLAPSARRRVRRHHVPEDIPALMAAADLAVTGGGQTAYELAAVGIPALGMRLAPDQTLNLRGLAAAGCLRDLGAPADPGFEARLAAALATLGADASARAEMSRCGRVLVDGRGGERVAGHIVRLAAAVAA